MGNRRSADCITGFNASTDFTQHLVVYPVSQGRALNVVACVTDPLKRNIIHDGPSTEMATQEEVMSAFKGWEEEVQALLKVVCFFVKGTHIYHLTV